ncbi:hypothetical protein K788_0006600 [Paraburkholderia caribensis MBA4]|uniref:Uncharacterized protein n=1 Tax=Paraburkholderia caribensis MBA4 TaxID=1323664 RepID=A0A0P0R8Z8_9BURK|nr:hypothetical protein K788_0006600 [Paraburkholderia caribensis MBA4]
MSGLRWSADLVRRETAGKKNALPTQRIFIVASRLAGNVY